MDPMNSRYSMESMDSMDSMESMDSMHFIDFMDSMESIESIESMDPMDSDSGTFSRCVSNRMHFLLRFCASVFQNPIQRFKRLISLRFGVRFRKSFRIVRFPIRDSTI